MNIGVITHKGFGLQKKGSFAKNVETIRVSIVTGLTNLSYLIVGNG